MLAWAAQHLTLVLECVTYGDCQFCKEGHEKTLRADAYLGWPGCLAASGMTLEETSLKAAMMLVTASVLMSAVASKS